MVHNGRPSHVGTQRQTVRATNTHTHKVRNSRWYTTAGDRHVGAQRQRWFKSTPRRILGGVGGAASASYFSKTAEGRRGRATYFRESDGSAKQENVGAAKQENVGAPKQHANCRRGNETSGPRRIPGSVGGSASPSLHHFSQLALSCGVDGDTLSSTPSAGGATRPLVPGESWASVGGTASASYFGYFSTFDKTLVEWPRLYTTAGDTRTLVRTTAGRQAGRRGVNERRE